MGVKIVIKDADFFADAISYIPPVSEGLQYLNFFGKSANTLARNLAPGKAPAVIVGNPLLSANGAGLSYLERYVKTGVAQTKSVTLISVVMIPTVATNIWRHLISNFGRDNLTGGLKWGVSLGLKLDSPDIRNTLGLVATDGSAASSTGNAAAVTLGTPVCAVARVDHVAKMASVNNMTTGLNRSATYAAKYEPELNGEFFVGSAVGARADSIGDVVTSFAAIYDRALTDGEVATVYAGLKAFYAAKGLAI